MNIERDCRLLLWGHHGSGQPGWLGSRQVLLLSYLHASSHYVCKDSANLPTSCNLSIRPWIARKETGERRAMVLSMIWYDYIPAQHRQKLLPVLLRFSVGCRWSRHSRNIESEIVSRSRVKVTLVSSNESLPQFCVWGSAQMEANYPACHTRKWETKGHD